MLFVFITGAAVFACDEKPPPTPAPGVPPADERITGSERLGWDQPAGDAAELASFHYAIYMDGMRSELAGTVCTTDAVAGRFGCSARLPAMSPGAHSLELAAFSVDDGVLESPKSPPLRVIVAPAAAPAATRASAWQSGTVITTSDRIRLRVELVADGLNEPTDLAFAPDGRLFIAERAGRVRIVRDGRLPPSREASADPRSLGAGGQAQPALAFVDVVTTGHGALLGLALDPRFDQTRFVYALYTTASRSGGRVFCLARFRETHDTLADRAILLGDIPARASHAAASVRFGGDGKLYVAFDDGGDPQVAGDMAAFNGKILRMNADGSTPDDQAGATPVFSYPYRSPHGLDWDSRTGTLWIADGEETGSTRLSAVIKGEGPSRRGVVRATYVLQPTSAGAPAVYRGSLIAAFQGDLLVAAAQGRHILRVHFDPREPGRIATTERLLDDSVGSIRVVAVAADGTIYFCTGTALARLVLAP